MPCDKQKLQGKCSVMIINSIKQKPVKAFNVDDFEYLLISVWLLDVCLFALI